MQREIPRIDSRAPPIKMAASRGIGALPAKGASSNLTGWKSLPQSYPLGR